MRNLIPILIGSALIACSAVQAATLTKEQYAAGKARIAAEYVVERQKCGARHGNSADVCIARARGGKKVALAELEAGYKPSPETNYAAAMARAQAAEVIAKEECDYRTRDMRKGCVKDAKAATQRARAEALARR